MLRSLFATTARQVAFVVGIATISSNLLVLSVWIALAPGSVLPGSVRALVAEVVAVTETLRALPPEYQPAMIAAVAQSMQWRIAPLGAEEPAGRADHVLNRALRERVKERGLSIAHAVIAPDGSSRHGVVISLRPGDSPALSISIGAERMRDVIPSMLLPPATIGLLLGVPLLLVLLWMASRITRPLARLADAAGGVSAAGHGLRLPEGGTSEVRALARAINGLLERLRHDVAERSRILAGISHDLRTPLTRLRLRVEGMQDQDMRQSLRSDLHRMESIITASLTLLEAELREEPHEPLDIASLAQTICDEHADAGHDASYHGPAHLVLRAQPGALQRALTNLVDNACKHAGAARVSIVEAPGQVSILVEDDGPGIAPTDLPLVTEAFRRGDASSAGSGLGLAIATSVARAHGGRLELHNRAAGGLCATLHLPRLDAA